MINGENKTQSHEYAENIINTIREPLLVLNQNLKVVAASRSFYQFFKVKPEETVGQLIYDLGNQQWNIPKLRDLLETILPQKASFDDYEVEHNFSTIGRRVMLLNARQIEQAMGKERIILLAIEDITERKHLNNLLADSEERYRRIFETASDGIFLLEKYEGHIIQSNPAAEAMLGYSTEESVGKNLQDIGVPLDTSDFQMLMQKLQSKGILTYENIPVKTRMGQDIFADIYMVDRAKLAQCNIRDVTLRKQAEADLRIALEKAHQEKAMSEAIIASMGEMMVIVNTDFEIIFQNQIMKDFRGDHIGEHCYTVYEHRDRACEDCPVAKAFADGGIHKALMNPTTTDKGALWIEFTASALKNREGNIIAGVELVRDLTDQKKLEAQLRQSQKMEAIGTLAGGIAHDFNNILNVILGYGTMVLESLEAGSAAREDMNEVLTAAERAVHLTNRLLVFSRKKDFFLEPVDIKELILSLKKMLTKILRESTDFYLNLADGAMIVQADAGQLEQVLINLTANAKDAMPECGRFIISTCLENFDAAEVPATAGGKLGRYACITVADTGQGMSAETQKRIFEPFFTTKGIGQGTGLGLAISYGIIKDLGGCIRVYSELGHGTEFKIYLPLSIEKASSGKEMKDTVPVRGGEETILVAEDEESLRKLTRITLESFGYRVITAKDGEEAITQFSANRESISLVLLDMIMPKKNGKEVSHAIRRMNPRIKILFTSGYTTDIDTTKEMTEVSSDFIHKPFQSKRLLFKVRELLDR